MNVAMANGVTLPLALSLYECYYHYNYLCLMNDKLTMIIESMHKTLIKSLFKTFALPCIH